MFAQVLLAFNEGRGLSKGLYLSSIAVRVGDRDSVSTLACETIPTGLKGLIASSHHSYTSKRVDQRIARNGGTLSRNDDAALRITAGYYNYLGQMGLKMNEAIDEPIHRFIWDFLGGMSPEDFMQECYKSMGKPVSPGAIAIRLRTKAGYQVRQALVRVAHEHVQPSSIIYDGLSDLFEVTKPIADNCIGNLGRLFDQDLPTLMEWQVRIENKVRFGKEVTHSDFGRVSTSDPALLPGTFPIGDNRVVLDSKGALRNHTYRQIVAHCSGLLVEELIAIFQAVEENSLAMPSFWVGSGPIGSPDRSRMVIGMCLNSLGTMQDQRVSALLSKIRRLCSYETSVRAERGTISTRIEFSLTKLKGRFKYEPDIPDNVLGSHRCYVPRKGSPIGVIRQPHG